MDSFYVYYRVETARREAALAAVHCVFEAVQARCGIRGRLMQRADDPATWMEIYEGVDDPTGFQTALEEIVATSGLPGTLADKSARHIEHFREQR